MSEHTEQPAPTPTYPTGPTGPAGGDSAGAARVSDAVVNAYLAAEGPYGRSAIRAGLTAAITEFLRGIRLCDDCRINAHNARDRSANRPGSAETARTPAELLLDRLASVTETYVLGRSGEPLPAGEMAAARAALVDALNEAWLHLRPNAEPEQPNDDPDAGISEEHIAQLPDEDIDALIELHVCVVRNPGPGSEPGNVHVGVFTSGEAAIAAGRRHVRGAGVVHVAPVTIDGDLRLMLLSGEGRS